MPIYEYECSSCHERFEKLVKINAPTPECPKCGAIEVRKLVSAAGFILKGGGWYSDHYGLKKTGGSSEGSGSGSSSSGGGSSGSSSSGSSSGGSSGGTSSASTSTP